MTETVWNQISTAPKDGTLMFLDYGDGDLCIGRFVDEHWWCEAFVTTDNDDGTGPQRLMVGPNRSPTPRRWSSLPLPPLLPDQEEEAAA